MPEPGDLDDSVLSVPVDANFANARPNRGHGLPIARFQSTLHQFQLVAHLLANRLGEAPRPFQAVTLPFNRLEPFSHWLQYTRTHIHREHRASRTARTAMDYATCCLPDLFPKGFHVLRKDRAGMLARSAELK